MSVGACGSRSTQPYPFARTKVEPRSEGDGKCPRRAALNRGERTRTTNRSCQARDSKKCETINRFFLRIERPIAGVAEAGNDVADVVETLVDRTDVDPHVRMNRQNRF